MWNHDKEKILVVLELFVYREFLTLKTQTLRLFDRSVPDHMTIRVTALYPIIGSNILRSIIGHTSFATFSSVVASN